jgi:hypothetical protein
MKSAEDFNLSLLKVLDFANDHKERVNLIRSRDKAIKDEAYNRGYANGQASRKHDEDWERVEANL